MRLRAKNLLQHIAERDRFSLSELYHENTKLRWINARQMGTWIETIKSYPDLIERLANAYKSYPTREKIPLLREFPESTLRLEHAILQRRTYRHFSGEPMTVEEVAKILHYSYGITGSFPLLHDPTQVQYLRAAPSAGGLYPLEIYPIVFQVADLDSGIYHYNVRGHYLEVIERGEFRDLCGEFTNAGEEMQTANVLFVISAIFFRTTFKYGERSYRLVLLDAGHLGQNFYLIATAMGLGTVPIGGFLDDSLNKLLKLDGVNESVLYPIIIGKLRQF